MCWLLKFIITVALGASRSAGFGTPPRLPSELRDPASTPLPQHAHILCAGNPRHLVCDWEVLFNADKADAQLAVECLRKLRPPRAPTTALGETLCENRQPWDDLEGALPTHRWRTFDTARKYTAVLRELGLQRPADRVLLVRLLLEEDAIGRPAVGGRANPGGTRPLTAGEISENWNPLLRERCLRKWALEEESGPINPRDRDAVESMLASIDAALGASQLAWLEEDRDAYAAATALTDTHDAARTQTPPAGGDPGESSSGSPGVLDAAVAAWARAHVTGEDDAAAAEVVAAAAAASTAEVRSEGGATSSSRAADEGAAPVGVAVGASGSGSAPGSGPGSATVLLRSSSPLADPALEPHVLALLANKLGLPATLDQSVLLAPSVAGPEEGSSAVALPVPPPLSLVRVAGVGDVARVWEARRAHAARLAHPGQGEAAAAAAAAAANTADAGADAAATIATEGCAFYGAYWKPLLLLGATARPEPEPEFVVDEPPTTTTGKGRGEGAPPPVPSLPVPPPSLWLVDWAKRCSTFSDRAAAKAHGRFFAANEVGGVLARFGRGRSGVGGGGGGRRGGALLAEELDDEAVLGVQNTARRPPTRLD